MKIFIARIPFVNVVSKTQSETQSNIWATITTSSCRRCRGHSETLEDLRTIDTSRFYTIRGRFNLFTGNWGNALRHYLRSVWQCNTGCADLREQYCHPDLWIWISRRLRIFRSIAFRKHSMSNSGRRSSTSWIIPTLSLQSHSLVHPSLMRPEQL